MIEVTTHGDVRRIRMWTRRSLAVGYDVSAFLVRGVLVDTGFRHVRRELVAVARGSCPHGAIVTHHHEDHAGNAPTLALAGIPLWMSAYTEAKLRERPRVKLYRHVIWGRPQALRAGFASFDPAPLQVIPTPGHAPDHHVVFDPDTRTLFSADLWLGVKVRVMGRHENPYEILRSLERAIALEPSRMFDAHRGLVEDPVPLLRAKGDWLADTIGAIERALDAGRSERALLKELLGGEEMSGYITEGEYSRRNFVRAVARHRDELSARGRQGFRRPR
jgi:glyoxylase-like metal-dependent hydrolase (beta-lactamase superfamily II)